MRWIFRIVGILVVLAVAGVAALFLVPADRIARIAAERFEASTGRSLAISGDVRPVLWPALGVSIGAVEIGNADWSRRGPMLTADSLSVAVDWSALMGGDIRVTGVTIDGPSILLEARDGAPGNWVMEGAASSSAGPEGASGAPRGLALDEARITGGRLTFVAADGAETVLDDVDATLRLPDFAGRATAEIAARANAQPVTLSATIDGFAAFLSDGAVPVTLRAGFGDGDLLFTGRAGLAPLAAQGRAEGSLGRMEGLFAALGRPRPVLREGLGRDGISFAGSLTYADDRVSLRGFETILDRNTVRADADIVLGGVRPRVTADIDLGAFVLPETSEEKAEAQGTSGWSTDPIDASALSLVDGTIGLRADSIALGRTRLGTTRLKTTIDNARAQTDILELLAYDGQVAGGFVVNNRSGLSVRTDLAGSAIAISRLFAELFDYDRLIALGDMELSVLGSGPSQAAILNSLNGRGSFSFGAGELLGLDLAGMLTHLDTKFIGQGSKTIFDSITGTFRIENGVVINEDLSFLAPLLTARGKGEVGIGGRTLNYRLVPQLRSGEDAGLSVPLIITGTWDNPKFRLDLEAMAKDRFGDKAKAATEGAKQKVQDKIDSELGVTAEDGKSREDAVKQKLKDEAAKGLLNLLKK